MDEMTTTISDGHGGGNFTGNVWPSRSNAGPEPSPRLSKQLCFRSQGSLANKLTGEGDGGDVDAQLTKMDVVLTFQIEVLMPAAYVTQVQLEVGSLTPSNALN